MIYLSRIEIRGRSDAGEFSGLLDLAPGLQVISARNSYGKSLAVKAVAWCFGLEPMFGRTDNDALRLPEAVREELDLGGSANAKVLSSECSTTVRQLNGRELTITRSVRGGDPSIATLREIEANGNSRESKLQVRKLTMQDEHGGLQRVLFQWLDWPRVRVPTFKPGGAEIYLENLAPLFYIDQDEGWTNLQALQVSRYGQQQIAEIAVEYLLGAFDALNARIGQIQEGQRASELRESARLIADQVSGALLRHGWRIGWSGFGSIADVITRWSHRKLRDALQQDASLNLDERFRATKERVEQLRRTLTAEPIDTKDSSAPMKASQDLVELKQKRHVLNQDLHTLRTQLEQASSLLEGLEHRLFAATDLHRLKTTGVGRIDILECPTCHRDIDPATFGLTSQSAESVAAHIEALKRDKDFIRKNVQSLRDNIEVISAEIRQVDGQMKDAERAFVTVTSAVGPLREQLAGTAASLTAAERELDRLADAAREIDDLQASIDRWIADAKTFEIATASPVNVEGKRNAFVAALRKYLVALGHSAVPPEKAIMVSLDDQYVPFMAGRRLRALGSASDQCRLIAAYSLALAAASEQAGGKHPGFVILDEPLQQNPDERHRELFIKFLTEQIAQQSAFQTVVFTSLDEVEIERLRGQGTAVITPAGDHFLRKP